jgi:hypothetical protein
VFARRAAADDDDVVVTHDGSCSRIIYSAYQAATPGALRLFAPRAHRARPPRVEALSPDRPRTRMSSRDRRVREASPGQISPALPPGVGVNTARRYSNVPSTMPGVIRSGTTRARTSDDFPKSVPTESPFRLRRLMLRAAMDTLLLDDVGAAVRPPDLANMGAFARRAPARSAGLTAPTAGAPTIAASAIAAREDRPLVLGRALAPLDRMENGARHGEA